MSIFRCEDCRGSNPNHRSIQQGLTRYSEGYTMQKEGSCLYKIIPPKCWIPHLPFQALLYMLLCPIKAELHEQKHGTRRRQGEILTPETPLYILDPGVPLRLIAQTRQLPNREDQTALLLRRKLKKCTLTGSEPIPSSSTA